ncbi:hypothetical protein [Mesorhizobium sp. B2-1-3A]|uniref:hypothetical protein n=1 Tax=Mesorhizobium sp. B2-1-3A TaxID=2589971 RepID=UPI00112C46B7|nr:hypothetical protein [Mesorhizobium sp. B2-1-3A]TPM90155.1 hypothetical protein FJ977_34765 [Mesorhizobium sp. B2-1-3A]
MSQTAEVTPPIVSEDCPDRNVNCLVALEAAFAALVSSAISKGWSATETAETLLAIATEHAEQVKAETASGT